MIAFTTRTYKNGSMSQQVPAYHRDDSYRESLAAVEGLRSFAARAGIRNAAKAAANKGWPIEVTMAVLLSEDIWNATNVFQYWKESE